MSATSTEQESTGRELTAIDASGHKGRPQTRLAELRFKYGGTVGALLVFLAVWQAYVLIAQPNPRLIPGPLAVVTEIWIMYDIGLLMPAFMESARAYAVGTGLAIFVGLVASILIGLSKLAQVITMPYLWAMFSMPRSALIPLLLLWFGLGFKLTIASIFLSAVVPLIIQVIEGMRTAEGSLLRMATMFTANRVDILRKVVMPGTVPYMANGMRQCLSRGFIGLVVVEMLVGNQGLGVQAMRAAANFNTARLMGMILILISVAVVLIVIARIIEDSVSKWRETIAI